MTDAALTMMASSSSTMNNNTDASSSTMNYGLVSGAVVDVGEAPPRLQQSSTTTQQELLTTAFEQYAQQHPNPNLAEEYEQRTALLQQVAKEQQQDGAPVKTKRSLFGMLFHKKARHDDRDGLYDTSTLNPDEWLEYESNGTDENSQQPSDALLCDSSLDTSCIPYEAFCMARFLLSCRRTVPNVARTTITEANSSLITLLHAGLLCQISQEGEHAVMETNDAPALQAQLPREYDVSRARAVVLSQDVLAVSWGLSDGIVVLYQCNTQHLTWDSVAVLSPTRAVSDTSPHHHGGNALLVTDVVPLSVQDPSSGDIVTTLAISRLGGYIEFIIIPKLPKRRTNKRKKRGRPEEHYAANLPNISYSDTSMTALTTADYHVDVVCLESFRTRVSSDTEWDTDLFPKSPPAEHVLVASGGTKEGEQVISYWGVSIVFPENVGQERASIHVSFLDGINVGTVAADVTVFSSDEMWNYWRRPRRVRLRTRPESVDDEGTEQGEATDKVKSLALVEEKTASKASTLSTLSTPMPIVRMRLTTTISDSKQEVVLAALDGNGGIRFIDCTAVIALAAHDVGKEELGDDSLLNLKCILPSKCLSSVVDIGWLSNEASGEGGALTSPLLTVIRPHMLQVLALPLSSELDGSDTIARVSYSLDVPSLAYGATAISSGSSQCLSFVTFTITETRRKLLCQGKLERLDSSTVIEMLVKTSKYGEAIEAAKAMNVPDSTDSIQFCHRKLWELDGNVKHLAQVANDDYVVNETLAIFDSEEPLMGLDLAAARAACLLALERATLLTERKEELVLRLEAVEAKVSTYILLCMSNDAVPQLSRFKEKFLPVPLRDLASAFASNGNISSLTTILFRHRPELLPCQLEILDKLPLEAPPESFAHLLPLSGPGRTRFHTGEHGVDGMREWSLMAHYMENIYDVRLVLDDKDEAVVLDRCRHFDGECNTLQANSIQEWYLTRARRIQHEIGSITLTRDFLQVASQRLDCSLGSSSLADDLDPSLRELCSIFTYAMQLDQICAGASSSLESGKLIANALATMSLSEIGEMSVDDRVALILGPPIDPSVVISKFRNGSMFLALGEQSAEQRERVIDGSVSVYCGNAIMNSVGENKTSAEPQQVFALRNALDVCTEIANASRTTIRRSNRIVKDKCTLMNLVLGTAYDTSKACKTIDISTSDCRHMTESIWEAYECLPARSSADKGIQSEIQERVDCLYKNLVVVDVLSRWSSAAIGFLGDLNRTETGEQRLVGKTEVGLVVITEMCRSFCTRIQGGASFDAELDLLQDLISDIDLANKVGFDGTLSLTLTVQEHLIKPLLQHQAFQLIDPLANWVGRDEVRATVLEFVNEAMFDNDDAGGDRVQAAIRCQDILGPLFPELQSEFESSRRFLDAAFFINRMNVGSNKVTYPCEVRDTLPLDMIESVLKENPACILDGCSEWTDPTFSRNANEAICQHYWSVQQANAEDSSPRNGERLPVLPGSAIYHLASLLGLQGSHPLLVVKSRVVYYAVGLSEFAAAAAVCATMVNENGTSWNEKFVADCIVDSVARVVSLNNYDDARMKLTLCNTVFEKCRSELSVLDIHSYETVLDSFVVLENTISRQRQPHQSPSSSPTSKAGLTQDGLEPTVNDFLVFRAVGMVAKTARNVARHANQPSDQSVLLEGRAPRLMSVHHRVYQDILTQYSTDVRDLFWTLRGVSASNKVDDPLLLTLGRLIGFWSIAEAMRLRPQSEPLELARSDLDDVLSLGTSLLLHAQDKEALVSCITELKGILSRETAATMERAASVAQPDSVVPDAAIVEALVSRGYSENGARRAAIMTGNESAQIALVWAVSHTLDEGFNDPMVNVASNNASSISGRIDQNMIHCMQETLNLANSYCLSKRTLESLLPATTALSNLLESKDVAQNGHGKPARIKVGEPRRPSKPANGHSDKIPSVRTKRIADSDTTTSESNGPEVARAVDASGTPAAKPAVAGLNLKAATQSKATKPVLTTASKPPPPLAENLPGAAQKGPLPKYNAAAHAAPKLPAASKLAEPKLSVPPPTRATPRSLSTPTVPKAPPVDRLSTLRSHDQTKTTGTNLASEERKRLIAEGRRMLREARASKATASSTATSVPAPTNRYPLRSRTPPLPDTTSTVPLSNPETAKPAPPPPSEDSDGSGWDFDDF